MAEKPTRGGVLQRMLKTPPEPHDKQVKWQRQKRRNCERERVGVGVCLTSAD